MVGPFESQPFKNLQVSPIGVVPKKEQGRLIHHLSYSDAQSMNDFIPEDAKRVMYASVDDAVKLIMSLGRNYSLAKSDIGSAYRNIPIALSDHELLGIM